MPSLLRSVCMRSHSDAHPTARGFLSAFHNNKRFASSIFDAQNSISSSSAQFIEMLPSRYKQRLGVFPSVAGCFLRMSLSISIRIGTTRDGLLVPSRIELCTSLNQGECW